MNYGRQIGVVIALSFSCTALIAEQGKMVLHVSDTHGHPVKGLAVATSGAGGGEKETDPTGRVVLLLAPETKANSSINIQIVTSPKGHDLVMISPWDGYTRVPSFDNDSLNFAAIVVAERGDRAILESLQGRRALAANANQANAAKIISKQPAVNQVTENLAAVAKQYGFAPEDVDKAIRALGKDASDPYDAGLAALYEKNYPVAINELGSSLEMREKGLKVAQDDVANAATFLGQSLYAQGNYKQAVAALDRAIQLRPESSLLQNEKGLGLYCLGDYAGAELLLRRAVSIREKTLGPDHVYTAISLSNLAVVLQAKGNYTEAEALFLRATAIDEKAVGPDHPKTAADLNNLAALLNDKHDYAGAEPLFRRALAINEALLGPNDPRTATGLNNLAEVLESKGDYVGAEPLFRRALAIDEKTLDPSHEDVARDLNNLGGLLLARGDYVGAEPLCRRALAIYELALGPDHPSTAMELGNLAMVLQAKGDYAEAESLFSRSVDIDERTINPESPGYALHLSDLAFVLALEKNYTAAESLFRRALVIDEKVLGPDQPATKMIRDNLAFVEAKLK